MAKSVYQVVTQGTGASQPKVDLVLTQPDAGPPARSAEEVADDAAVAGNTDSSPSLINSVVVDGSSTGLVDDDITAGGVGSAMFFYTQTRKADGSIAGLNILSMDKQQGFAAYAGGTTYAIGNTVDFGSNSYKSKVNANTGNQPDTHPTEWDLFNKKAYARAVAEGITAAGGGATGYANRWLGGLAITIDAS